MRRAGSILAPLLALAWGPVLAAPPPLPPELETWVPWVLDGHEESLCPRLDGRAQCLWPGRLGLDLNERGGSFELAVRADAYGVLSLPGGPDSWPREVSDLGRPALLIRSGEIPAVALEPGDHELRGALRWSRLPESLAVPGAIALLQVSVNGEELSHPRRDAGGLLWLRGTDAEAAAEDRLSLEVHRRIDDGVPVLLTTRLRLRVSGSSREAEFGDPLPEGQRAISLRSPLPARLDSEGRLKVQLRPGDWELRIRSRSVAPMAELAAPAAGAPWPAEEIWVFAADEAVRSVRLGGAPGVDPQRTSLPEEWRDLPAFRVARDGGLSFDELQRGDAQPPPDDLSVRRELWLDQGGKRWTVSDSLSGRLHRGGRIEATAPGNPGRISVDGQDRVVTLAPDGSGAGAELRSGRLDLGADLAYATGGRLPAVGWNRDAGSLHAEVHLPPGWTLLGASGPDSAHGSWLDRWGLLDLFLLLLLSAGVWRLFDLRWALLALAVLGVAWHEPNLPRAGWLVLLLLLALERALQAVRIHRLLRWARWTVATIITIQLVVFAWEQTRTGLFPQIAWGGQDPLSGAEVYQERDRFVAKSAMQGSDSAQAPQHPMATEELAVDMPESEAGRGAPAEPPAAAPSLGLERSYRPRKGAAQIDPQDVAQTGPGVPRWSWTTASLQWDGAVRSTETVRLWLIAPWFNTLLAMLRVLGVVLLAWRILVPKPLRPAGSGPSARGEAAALALLAIGLAPASARADVPPAPMLEELRTRLLAPPDCEPDCAETASLDLSAGPRGLRMEVVVHAASVTSWKLPGPVVSWAPTRVEVDGRAATALARAPDGYLALRLEPGVHRVVLAGPARDAVSLQFAQRPRLMSWTGVGWTIEGYRPDAPAPASVDLARHQALASSSPEDEVLEFKPWLQLERQLDIGVPWLVHYTLRRLSPPGTPVRIKVPLLPGESVTSGDVEVLEGQAEVTLATSETERNWDATLDEVSDLTLRAAAEAPWSEVWELRCSPIWNCAASGLPPTQHMEGGRWLPRWNPWPGEELKLRFLRPEAAPGNTSIIDRAELRLEPARALREANLSLELRSSQGGDQRLQLPAGAQIQSFRIDGTPRPVQVQDGQLRYSTEPGAHSVELAWRQDHRMGVVERAPLIDLGQPAVNISVRMEVPRNRWLLWTGGPRWGPVVTLWQYVLVLVLLSVLLARWAPTPLRIHDWFLLGLGMTQVPLQAAVVVVLWLIALGLRGRHPPGRWWTLDGAQVLLALTTIVAFFLLTWAVVEGLALRPPDMQVEGAGSWGQDLQWYADRSDGALPRPYAVWLPTWVWNIAMLLWALWLAFRYLTWLTWGWRQANAGALWMKPVLRRPRAESWGGPGDPVPEGGPEPTPESETGAPVET
jgi:hypothetical protein